MRINVRAEFDHAIKQMEWGEVLDTLQVAIEDELGVTPNTPPSTQPPPVLSAELGFDIHPQPVGDAHDEVHGGCSSHHLGIATHGFEQPVTAAQTIQEGPLYRQAGVHSQGQHTLYPSSVSDHPGPSTTAYYHAAPPYTCDQAPAISFCESTGQNQIPLRLVNGELVYAYTFHHPDSAAPPAPTSMSKKRKRRYDKPQDDDRPYVKKPLNAFMLFMKEQRQNVVAEINNRNNATVNSVLGQRWASLSNKEKHRFYEKAEKERLLHAKQNPGWSSSNNYVGKKEEEAKAEGSDG
ncbi:hypothetical protein Q5P01_024807 [Channa striata]|uniref:HMG box domain-containing protein n=1 Tax=Channa striata TaxID=64152 RepID=A0AA88IR66_CHASR|nr:hypothetical protein Q5P01_024807 [Channa striata]